MSQYSDHFDKAYKEYNNVLRLWFVAFGVGVPGAVLLSPETKSIVAGAEAGSLALVLLLGGSALQIMSALLNKYVAWCNDFILYREHFPPENARPIPKIIKNFAALTEHIWIDFVIDLLTGAMYLYSLYLLYDVLI